MQIAACIFDVDGVVVDTARFHFQAWRRLARELGFALAPAEAERLKGVSRMASLEIVLALGDLSVSPAEKEGLAARKNEWYLELVGGLKPCDVAPGFLRLLEGLERRGLRVAAASSSRNARLVLKRLDLFERFACVVDGQRLTHPKPHPQVFLIAAQEMRVEPARCLVFEDGAAGVAAARAAGMGCVGVGDPVTLHEADCSVLSLEGIEAGPLLAAFAGETPRSRVDCA